MELFSAHFTVKNFFFRGQVFNSMTFMLFRADEKREFSEEQYRRLIKDYYPDGYAEEAIEELFSREEIEQMESYFKRFPRSVFGKRKMEFPIENNIMPYGAIPVGGSADFVCFPKLKNYSLDFRVWGYFDVRGQESEGMPIEFFSGMSKRPEITYLPLWVAGSELESKSLEIVSEKIDEIEKRKRVRRDKK